jgi:dienelactone hydrolase
MAYVIWVHSIYGKRPAILDEAWWVWGLGHSVVAPDLYRGKYFDNDHDGDKYMKSEGGYAGMLKRLDAATKDIGSAVWAGWSMGAYLAQEMAKKRAKEDPNRRLNRRPIGLLLMSFGLIAPVPFGVKAQVHATKGDIKWEELKDSERNGAKVFHYEGAGHIFADRGLRDDDYNSDAKAKWETNVKNFLKTFPRRRF